MRFRWTEMLWVCLKDIHDFFLTLLFLPWKKTYRSKRFICEAELHEVLIPLTFFECCYVFFGVDLWSLHDIRGLLQLRIWLIGFFSAKPFKIWLRLCKLSIRRSNRREFNPEDSIFSSSLRIEVRIGLQSRIKLKSNVSLINISSHCCSNQYFETHIKAHRSRPRWSLKLNSTFLRINN